MRPIRSVAWPQYVSELRGWLAPRAVAAALWSLAAATASRSATAQQTTVPAEIQARRRVVEVWKAKLNFDGRLDSRALAHLSDSAALTIVPSPFRGVTVWRAVMVGDAHANACYIASNGRLLVQLGGFDSTDTRQVAALLERSADRTAAVLDRLAELLDPYGFDSVVVLRSSVRRGDPRAVQWRAALDARSWPADVDSSAKSGQRIYRVTTVTTSHGVGDMTWPVMFTFLLSRSGELTAVSRNVGDPF